MIDYIIRKNLPFAVWSLPGDHEWKGIAQNNYEITEIDFADIFQANGFVISPFNAKNKARLINPDLRLDSRSFELNSEPGKPLRNSSLEEDALAPVSIDKQTYLEACRLLIDAIHAGKAGKAILSRIKSIDFDFNRLLDYYTVLLKDYPKAMVFIYSIGDGIWIGASPEVFLKIEKQSFATMALAGSKPIDDTKPWNKKEIDEQLYVSRFIGQNLKELGISYREVGPETIAAGPVAHLQTLFSGSVDKGQIGDLIRALHPTPAVCGMPKENARELIAEVEMHDRLDYTGFFGPVENNNINLYVNLRSALIRNDKMHLFIGGGITLDSIPEKEWKETELKAQTLLNSYKKC